MRTRLGVSVRQHAGMPAISDRQRVSASMWVCMCMCAAGRGRRVCNAIISLGTAALHSRALAQTQRPRLGVRAVTFSVHAAMARLTLFQSCSYAPLV